MTKTEETQYYAGRTDKRKIARNITSNYNTSNDTFTPTYNSLVLQFEKFFL